MLQQNQSPTHQQLRRNPERLGEPVYVEQRDVPLAALDSADVGAIEPGLEGQTLLGQPLLLSQFPDAVAESDQHSIHTIIIGQDDFMSTDYKYRQQPKGRRPFRRLSVYRRGRRRTREAESERRRCAAAMGSLCRARRTLSGESVRISQTASAESARGGRRAASVRRCARRTLFHIARPPSVASFRHSCTHSLQSRMRWPVTRGPCSRLHSGDGFLISELSAVRHEFPESSNPRPRSLHLPLPSPWPAKPSVLQGTRPSLTP
jgi:hypothetical protein